jgi:hypothetical protein
MKHLKVLFMALGLSAALTATSLSEYTRSVTNATSTTITGAQHNMGSVNYAIGVFDSNGVRQSESNYTVSKDSITYNVTISWASAFTGSVKLVGAADNDTAGDDQFKLQNGSNGTASIVICPSCTMSAWERKTWSSLSYVSSVTSEATDAAGGFGCNGTVYVYIYNRRLTFAHSVSASCINVTKANKTQGSSYPSGSIAIGTASHSGLLGTFTLSTDDRPWKP